MESLFTRYFSFLQATIKNTFTSLQKSHTFAANLKRENFYSQNPKSNNFSNSSKSGKAKSTKYKKGNAKDCVTHYTQVLKLFGYTKRFIEESDEQHDSPETYNRDTPLSNLLLLAPLEFQALPLNFQLDSNPFGKQ